MPTLETSEGCISYLEAGVGSTDLAMLLHGSPGDAHNWAPMAEVLGQHTHVIAPDLPGRGETEASPAADPTMDHSARMLSALTQELGQPRLLAGYSYGGALALALALRGVVRPRQITLFEPVATPVLAAAGEHALFDATVAIFDEYLAMVDAGTPDAVGHMIDFWFGPGSYAKFPPKLVAYLNSRASLNAIDVRSTFGEPFDLERIVALDCPIMVVVGSLSPRPTQRIAEIIVEAAERGTLKTLEGANHAMLNTHASSLTDLLRTTPDGC